MVKGDHRFYYLLVRGRRIRVERSTHRIIDTEEINQIFGLNIEPGERITVEQLVDMMYKSHDEEKYNDSMSILKFVRASETKTEIVEFKPEAAAEPIPIDNMTLHQKFDEWMEQGLIAQIIDEGEYIIDEEWCYLANAYVCRKVREGKGTVDENKWINIVQMIYDAANEPFDSFMYSLRAHALPDKKDEGSALRQMIEAIPDNYFKFADFETTIRIFAKAKNVEQFDEGRIKIDIGEVEGAKKVTGLSTKIVHCRYGSNVAKIEKFIIDKLIFELSFSRDFQEVHLWMGKKRVGDRYFPLKDRDVNVSASVGIMLSGVKLPVPCICITEGSSSYFYDISNQYKFSPDESLGYIWEPENYRKYPTIGKKRGGKIDTFVKLTLSSWEQVESLLGKRGKLWETIKKKQINGKYKEIEWMPEFIDATKWKYSITKFSDEGIALPANAIPLFPRAFMLIPRQSAYYLEKVDKLSGRSFKRAVIYRPDIGIEKIYAICKNWGKVLFNRDNQLLITITGEEDNLKILKDKKTNTWNIDIEKVSYCDDCFVDRNVEEKHKLKVMRDITSNVTDSIVRLCYRISLLNKSLKKSTTPIKNIDKTNIRTVLALKTTACIKDVGDLIISYHGQILFKFKSGSDYIYGIHTQDQLSFYSPYYNDSTKKAHYRLNTPTLIIRSKISDIIMQMNRNKYLISYLKEKCEPDFDASMFTNEIDLSVLLGFKKNKDELGKVINSPIYDHVGLSDDERARRVAIRNCFTGTGLTKNDYVIDKSYLDYLCMKTCIFRKEFDGDTYINDKFAEFESFYKNIYKLFNVDELCNINNIEFVYREKIILDLFKLRNKDLGFISTLSIYFLYTRKKAFILTKILYYLYCMKQTINDGITYNENLKEILKHQDILEGKYDVTTNDFVLVGGAGSGTTPKHKKSKKSKKGHGHPPPLHSPPPPPHSKTIFDELSNLPTSTTFTTTDEKKDFIDKLFNYIISTLLDKYYDARLIKLNPFAFIHLCHIFMYCGLKYNKIIYRHIVTHGHTPIIFKDLRDFMKSKETLINGTIYHTNLTYSLHYIVAGRDNSLWTPLKKDLSVDDNDVRPFAMLYCAAIRIGNPDEYKNLEVHDDKGKLVKKPFEPVSQKLTEILLKGDVLTNAFIKRHFTGCGFIKYSDGDYKDYEDYIDSNYEHFTANDGKTIDDLYKYNPLYQVLVKKLSKNKAKDKFGKKIKIANFLCGNVQIRNIRIFEDIEKGYYFNPDIASLNDTLNMHLDKILLICENDVNKKGIVLDRILEGKEFSLAFVVKLINHMYNNTKTILNKGNNLMTFILSKHYIVNLTNLITSSGDLDDLQKFATTIDNQLENKGFTILYDKTLLYEVNKDIFIDDNIYHMEDDEYTSYEGAGYITALINEKPIGYANYVKSATKEELSEIYEDIQNYLKPTSNLIYNNKDKCFSIDNDGELDGFKDYLQSMTIEKRLKTFNNLFYIEKLQETITSLCENNSDEFIINVLNGVITLDDSRDEIKKSICYFIEDIYKKYNAEIKYFNTDNMDQDKINEAIKFKFPFQMYYTMLTNGKTENEAAKIAVFLYEMITYKVEDKDKYNKYTIDMLGKSTFAEKFIAEGFVPSFEILMQRSAWSTGWVYKMNNENEWETWFAGVVEILGGVNIGETEASLLIKIYENFKDIDKIKEYMSRFKATKDEVINALDEKGIGRSKNISTGFKMITPYITNIPLPDAHLTGGAGVDAEESFATDYYVKYDTTNTRCTNLLRILKYMKKNPTRTFISVLFQAPVISLNFNMNNHLSTYVLRKNYNALMEILCASNTIMIISEEEKSPFLHLMETIKNEDLTNKEHTYIPTNNEEKIIGEGNFADSVNWFDYIFNRISEDISYEDFHKYCLAIDGDYINEYWNAVNIDSKKKLRNLIYRENIDSYPILTGQYNGINRALAAVTTYMDEEINRKIWNYYFTGINNTNIGELITTLKTKMKNKKYNISINGSGGINILDLRHSDFIAVTPGGNPDDTLWKKINTFTPPTDDNKYVLSELCLSTPYSERSKLNDELFMTKIDDISMSFIHYLNYALKTDPTKLDNIIKYVSQSNDTFKSTTINYCDKCTSLTAEQCLKLSNIRKALSTFKPDAQRKTSTIICTSLVKLGMLEGKDCKINLLNYTKLKNEVKFIERFLTDDFEYKYTDNIERFKAYFANYPEYNIGVEPLIGGDIISFEGFNVKIDGNAGKLLVYLGRDTSRTIANTILTKDKLFFNFRNVESRVLSHNALISNRNGLIKSIINNNFEQKISPNLQFAWYIAHIGKDKNKGVDIILPSFIFNGIANIDARNFTLDKWIETLPALYTTNGAIEAEKKALASVTLAFVKSKNPTADQFGRLEALGYEFIKNVTEGFKILSNFITDKLELSAAPTASPDVKLVGGADVIEDIEHNGEKYRIEYNDENTKHKNLLTILKYMKNSSGRDFISVIAPLPVKIFIDLSYNIDNKKIHPNVLKMKFENLIKALSSPDSLTTTVDMPPLCYLTYHNDHILNKLGKSYLPRYKQDPLIVKGGNPRPDSIKWFELLKERLGKDLSLADYKEYCANLGKFNKYLDRTDAAHIKELDNLAYYGKNIPKFGNASADTAIDMLIDGGLGDDKIDQLWGIHTNPASMYTTINGVINDHNYTIDVDTGVINDDRFNEFFEGAPLFNPLDRDNFFNRIKFHNVVLTNLFFTSSQDDLKKHATNKIFENRDPVEQIDYYFEKLGVVEDNDKKNYLKVLARRGVPNAIDRYFAYGEPPDMTGITADKLGKYNNVSKCFHEPDYNVLKEVYKQFFNDPPNYGDIYDANPNSIQIFLKRDLALRDDINFANIPTILEDFDKFFDCGHGYGVGGYELSGGAEAALNGFMKMGDHKNSYKILNFLRLHHDENRTIANTLLTTKTVHLNYTKPDMNSVLTKEALDANYYDLIRLIINNRFKVAMEDVGMRLAHYMANIGKCEDGDEISIPKITINTVKYEARNYNINKWCNILKNYLDPGYDVPNTADEKHVLNGVVRLTKDYVRNNTDGISDVARGELNDLGYEIPPPEPLAPPGVIVVPPLGPPAGHGPDPAPLPPPPDPAALVAPPPPPGGHAPAGIPVVPHPDPAHGMPVVIGAPVLHPEPGHGPGAGPHALFPAPHVPGLYDEDLDGGGIAYIVD